MRKDSGRHSGRPKIAQGSNSLSLLLDGAGTLGLAGLEAVGELAGDLLEVAHAAGADSLSALSLVRPVVCVPC